MNSNNLKMLLQHIQQNTEVSYEVNELANHLIKDLQIQSGFGLAGFLSVDNHFDNYTAVRYWIHQQYVKIDTGDEVENYAIIKDNFLDCMPDMA